MVEADDFAQVESGDLDFGLHEADLPVEVLDALADEFHDVASQFDLPSRADHLNLSAFEQQKTAETVAELIRRTIFYKAF